MTCAIKLFDVVALTQDLPDEGLVRGQVGTVVEQYDADAYEVEFCDDNGQTYALATVQPEQVMVLCFRPTAAA